MTSTLKVAVISFQGIANSLPENLFILWLICLYLISLGLRNIAFVGFNYLNDYCWANMRSFLVGAWNIFPVINIFSVFFFLGNSLWIFSNCCKQTWLTQRDCDVYFIFTVTIIWICMGVTYYISNLTDVIITQ